MTALILIVDDDPIQRRLLEAMARRFGYDAECVDSGEAALMRLEASDRPPINLLILDLVMPDLDGMGVLARMRQREIAVPAIVQTAHGSIEVVISAMRAGATDFVVKPVGAERLQVSIRNALRVDALEDELRRATRRNAGELSFRDIVTRAESMARTVRLAERAAKSNIPVLIEGESGVGKELMARAIQGGSDRRGKPFIIVNCGALPETLVESILFGHEKGAFTGATDKHAGKFAEANGGTLFLDEIGELPPEAQVKLLRALQEGEIDPVGSRRPVKVDFRLVSATNKNLIELVKAGRFREDLFYRLNVFPIEAPALRDRREDVPALLDAFIRRFNVEEGKRVVAATGETVAMLSAYDWPGNVRQLENTVYRAIVLADAPYLQPHDFPAVSGVSAPVTMACDSPVETAPQRSAPLESSTAKPASHAPSGEDAPVRILDHRGHLRTLEEIERDLIQLAIEIYAGHMTEVARRLGIGRSTLYRKVREQGLEELVKEAG
jgi:DNA-binding NtrC family response regulator